MTVDPCRHLLRENNSHRIMQPEIILSDALALPASTGNYDGEPRKEIVVVPVKARWLTGCS